MVIFLCAYLSSPGCPAVESDTSLHVKVPAQVISMQSVDDFTQLNTLKTKQVYRKRSNSTSTQNSTQKLPFQPPGHLPDWTPEEHQLAPELSDGQGHQMSALKIVWASSVK